MPTTRKKIIKTVYKDEESEGETGDFSDSGSEAKISEVSSSEDEEINENNSSGDDFNCTSKKVTKNKQPVRRKTKFAKDLINKINKQIPAEDVIDATPALFSVKDLTDEDKLLPSVLNLSESDSSDDECETQNRKKTIPASTSALTSIYEHNTDSDNDITSNEYRDVWANNKPENSEEIAKKAFKDLERHTKEIEQTKVSIQNYISKNDTGGEANVKDLLAVGEQIIEYKSPSPIRTKNKTKKRKDDSDSDIEDWEEVKESKSIPQQGLQLYVELPDSVCRKSKKLDVEMMMKRKINKVKKEYQVYMHKVHVLCWLGHGIYVNRVLNDQEVMTAALAMVPKGCYPEERVTMKYVEQITTWFKDKLVKKQDKNEHKFKPKAPALKNIILNLIRTRVTTAKKYNAFIFVTMLRALGLQCRIMFNFVTLPIRPPSSELCSLSTKTKDEQKKVIDKSADDVAPKSSNKNKEKSKSRAAVKSKSKCNANIAQVDGIYDTFSESDSDNENIMQLDGNNDTQIRARSMRSTKAKKVDVDKNEDEGVSPPKRSKTIVKTEKAVKIKLHKSLVNKAVTTSKGDKIETGVKTRNISKPENEKKNNVIDKLQDSQKSPASNKAIKSDKDVIKTKRKILKSPRSKKNNVLEITITDKTLTPQSSTSLSNKVDDDDSELNVGKSKSDENEFQKSTASKRAMKRKEDKDALEAKSVTLKSPQLKNINELKTNTKDKTLTPQSSLSLSNKAKLDKSKNIKNSTNSPKTRSTTNSAQIDVQQNFETGSTTILVTDENLKKVESKFFSEPNEKPTKRNLNLSRKRSRSNVLDPEISHNEKTINKTRTKSAPGTAVEKSKYFDSDEGVTKKPKLNIRQVKKLDKSEDKLRVSHKDLLTQKAKPKNDVTKDLVNIMKSRIKVEKAEARKGMIKGKVKDDSDDDDSDFLPVEEPKSQDSDDDFKPTKISPRPIKISPKASLSKKVDRRVLSSDDDAVKSNKMDVWCEVFVEELEQWVAIDVVKGKVHCANDLYTNATHPICYIVGWDNNNYLKDLTRRYVPHWNTVTRKQRAEPEWWREAIQPWLGPKTARDREEDEQLDRMQLEAPLPKSIAEYKNHPLYALKRHLLKFEALYPPDAATLGFVRGEAVYSRDCVYTCRSRDTWVKEAKVVKLGEQPYKVVKARPKWDKLSNKLITDKPLEVFGPWQVQDYEPPTAENGKVPRNPYGNVELFKACMLPKGTVHIKLPGLNKVARKLNIDCAPAMTGFDFNGGWSHPVYDGFVVCTEFEEIITEAWVKEQEEQERREREKTELRVYGNWKRLIRGLMIRERLKLKYGFEEPTTSQTKSKSKGPRLVVKKKY